MTARYIINKVDTISKSSLQFPPRLRWAVLWQTVDYERPVLVARFDSHHDAEVYASGMGADTYWVARYEGD